MANPQYQREDLNPQDPTKQIKVSGEFSERIVEEISPENQILRNHLERASDVMYDKVRRKDFRNKITNEKGNIVGWVKFPREFINEMIDTLNKVDNERHLMRQLEGVTYHSFGLESDLNEVRDIGNMFVGKERKKEIENYIQKLSQMARAAGIHIIMATQRPSVDVITGTIKANFPTRISFQVSSKIDSRTILGEQGAEQLLGKGDMLYMSSANRIVRIHAPFVSDNEIEKINNFLISSLQCSKYL